MNQLLVIVALSLVLYLLTLIKMPAKVWGVIVFLLILSPETRTSVFPIFAIIVIIQTGFKLHRYGVSRRTPSVTAAKPRITF